MDFEAWVDRRAKTFIGQFCVILLRFAWVYGALDIYHAAQGIQRFVVAFATIAILNITRPVVAAIEAWYQTSSPRR
jgi:hypothetical protein